MRRVSTAFVLAALVVAAYVPGAAAAGHTVVVFVGGLGSTRASDFENFGLLRAQLLSPAGGYAARDLRYLEYDSCESLASAEADLAGSLRALRDSGEASGVVLVGHSNGGVVAFDVPVAYPDLAPFVRRIVTVDSPLGGISGWDALAEDVGNGGSCPAAHDLSARFFQPGWADYVGQLAAWETQQGIAVAAVANIEDGFVPFDRQMLPAVLTHAVDVADGGWNNHAAVLKTPFGVAQLVPLIGRQGQ